MPSIATVSIYVTDLNAAVDFYGTHLGFKVRSKPAPVIVELEHDGVGVVLCLANKATKHDYPAGAGTVIGIAWQDVAEASVRLLKANVDVVIKDPEPFPGGRFIAVRDPAGNVVELLEFDK